MSQSLVSIFNNLFILEKYPFLIAVHTLNVYILKVITRQLYIVA